MLCARINAEHRDPMAFLIATIVLDTWRIAFGEALRRHISGDTASSQRVFLGLLDRGFQAAETAADATPYA